MDHFRALVIEPDGAGGQRAALQALPLERLREGDVLLAVSHSSLNYKDGLAITGRGKILRRLPMIPGVDLAGTVLDSRDPRWRKGDRVILNGWGVGESHEGGYAERARVRGDWLLALPEGLSPRRAMAIGTAGLTAMLCIQAVESIRRIESTAAIEVINATPESLSDGIGDVVVTGAGGGVGSMAVALASRLGWRVVASTGRAELADWLRGLGAAEVIGREPLLAGPERPLATARWAAAIDSVGGETLAGLIRQAAPGACIAACGLAGGAELHTTVYPFILRGVTLAGIDSVQCPIARRAEAYRRIVELLPGELIDAMSGEITLEELPAHAEAILAGQVRGRIVVRLGDYE